VYKHKNWCPKGEIGLKGKLPWHIPEDLKLFKKLTLGHCLIMGRVTYEGILRDFKRPLPQRHHLVLTRQLEGKAHRDTGEWKTIFSSSLRDENIFQAFGEVKYFLAGGAAIYQEYLNQCSIIHLSLVDYQGPADTFIDLSKLINHSIFKIEEEVQHTGFRYLRYVKTV